MNPNMQQGGFGPNMQSGMGSGFAPNQPFMQPMPGMQGMPGGGMPMGGVNPAVMNQGQGAMMPGQMPYGFQGAFSGAPVPGAVPAGASQSGVPGSPDWMPGVQEAQSDAFSVENMASPEDIYASQGTPIQDFGQRQQEMPEYDEGMGGYPYGAQPTQSPQPTQPTQSTQPMPQDPHAPFADAAYSGMSAQSGMYGVQDVHDFAAAGYPGQPGPQQWPAQEPYVQAPPESTGQFAQVHEMRESHDRGITPDSAAMPSQVPDHQVSSGQADFGAYPQDLQSQQYDQSVDFVADYYHQQYPDADQPYFYDNVVIEPLDANAASPGKATLSLILGILSIVFVVIPPVGLILGFIAMRMAGKYMRNGGESGKAGVARILGIVGFVVSIITFILLIALFALIAGASFWSTWASNLISFINASFLGSIVTIPVPAYSL